MINGWPERGDIVVWTGGNRPVALRVADSLIVAAGEFAYLEAYLAGSSRLGTYFVRRGEVTVMAGCPRCLRTRTACEC
jgi:hypothetical protein